VDEKIVGRIDHGLMLLIGVAESDTVAEVEYAAAKCANLRIFEDDDGKMNRSLLEVGGQILAISQFTLLGDIRRGRRPSFISAARPEKGQELYNYFIRLLKELGIHVETGIFGAMMDVALVNAGPVTLIVDSDDK
jgi:D-tyrosyl-tRNA(Tyr) deacylase